MDQEVQRLQAHAIGAIIHNRINNRSDYSGYVIYPLQRFDQSISIPLQRLLQRHRSNRNRHAKD
jgi:hypothetical protein